MTVLGFLEDCATFILRTCTLQATHSLSLSPAALTRAFCAPIHCIVESYNTYFEAIDILACTA